LANIIQKHKTLENQRLEGKINKIERLGFIL